MLATDLICGLELHSFLKRQSLSSLRQLWTCQTLNLDRNLTEAVWTEVWTGIISEGRINLIFILSVSVICPLLPSSSAFITVKGLMNIYSADWAPEGSSLQHKTGREVRVITHLHPRVQMKPPSSVKFVHFNPVSCL